MSKKVLIISLSPRRGGNSDLLCDEFAKGVREAGNEVEKVSLLEKKINYCTGCGYCFNHKGQCSQKDDMIDLKEKMENADVIVLSTPIYFYTMAGQMKTFIDRNCFFYTLLENKEFYYIMTAADGNKEAMSCTMEEFGGYLACLDGARAKGCIFGTGVWNKGDVVGSSAMKEAFEMGKNA